MTSDMRDMTVVIHPKMLKKGLVTIEQLQQGCNSMGFSVLITDSIETIGPQDVLLKPENNVRA